ncbi:hydantoinase/oxoprolinase family protein [Bordetella tumulicola]|uniref:hydantoinase/oxoprolinase family protein n=1 Tax=Bordetella tumulicola TaxID=1649133 RepID=UPI0039F12399
MYRIGIDVGGTFTDFTLVNSQTGEVAFFKVPSTPHDPSEAIHQGIAGLMDKHSLESDQIEHIGHGTTVATNLIIERKVASCGLITTRGFRDVLEIARQIRPHLYDYSVTRPTPLVRRALRQEVPERISPQGEILEPLDETAVRTAAEVLRTAGVQAVAICFLHAYRNPDHERRARDIVREILPDVYISLSSDVLPEFREYERLSTTTLNAAVGPRMERYLQRFLERVADIGIRHEPHTIHSNGGLMSVQTVRQFPVRTCLSGPAAGVVGTAVLGRTVGFPNVVTFDVGGTSTDVSLIVGGRPAFTSSRSVAGYPVKTPMVDIHVIGAGGGSIAWIDEAGSLKVGPHSAGAAPGPVGYARGGTEPTITDAMLTLQRLNPLTLLKGRMKVDAAAAREVIARRIAEPLELSVEAAAEGIIRIANANMARAIRSVSTERGHELSKFALCAFGGAGPLHALDVARECGVPTVIIPQEPGTLCARGILLTDVSFDFVESEIAIIEPDRWSRVLARLDRLRIEANNWLEQEGVDTANRDYEVVIDARYVGQNFEVQVALPAHETATFEAFHLGFAKAHMREYGYEVPDRAIEIINCRTKAIGRVTKAPLRRLAEQAIPEPISHRLIHFGQAIGWCETSVYDRDQLGAGASFEGPAVFEEMSSTTVIAPGQSARVDEFGNIVVRV